MFILGGLFLLATSSTTVNAPGLNDKIYHSEDPAAVLITNVALGQIFGGLLRGGGSLLKWRFN